jgi:hypothetical protein
MDGEIPISFASGWAAFSFVVIGLVTAFMSGKIKPASWTDAHIAAVEKDRDVYREKYYRLIDDLMLPHIQADMLTQQQLLEGLRNQDRRFGKPPDPPPEEGKG